MVTNQTPCPARHPGPPRTCYGSPNEITVEWFCSSYHWTGDASWNPLPTRRRCEGSAVQICPSRPFFSFGPFEDQIEGLSVGGIDTCTVDRTVQKDDSQQNSLFGRFSHKVKKIGLVR